jgi:hypothetical protein
VMIIDRNKAIVDIIDSLKELPDSTLIQEQVRIRELARQHVGLTLDLFLEEQHVGATIDLFFERSESPDVVSGKEQAND